MATRTVIELIDDLDAREATETIRFGLDGSDYEIDLNDDNARELRNVLTRFADAGRKASARTTFRKTTVAASVDNKAVRQWATENGISLSPRGRIKDGVVQQYLASLS